ncbi:MAG: hypothetical protein ACOH1K_03845 [Rhodoglobus sp.]
MSEPTGPVTIQQLDPLGTLDGRPLSIAAAVAVLAVSTVMTSVNSDSITNPVLAVAALALIGVASATLIVTISSLRTLFSRAMHSVVIGLLVLAYALSSASLGGAALPMTNYWGTVIIGAMCLALAPYRPVAQQITVGVLASIVVGTIGLVSATFLKPDAPMALVFLASMTPVLTMALGGAAFTGSLAHTHLRWVTHAQGAAHRQREGQQLGVERSVQQDHITILNRDVVPLFTELAERGTISEADRARAAKHSESIRRLMVTEVNRSWLEAVVAHTFGALDDGDRVRDPHRLAALMTASQRAALRTAIQAVAIGTELSRESVRLVIEKTESGAVVIVTAAVLSSESVLRSTLAPYLAVLRVVFTGLQTSYRSPALTVRFTYDTD